MNKSRSDRPAHEVHSALKSALQDLEKAQQCAVLWFSEILERKLYQELGFSSINQYAAVELGFSATRTSDFVMLSRKLKKLPVMKEKLESGELGYTAARVIAPVLDQDNEKYWVDFATKNSRRVLERAVKRARHEAVNKKKGQQPLLETPQKLPTAVLPIRVSMEMSPAQFARYEKLWEHIRKHGGAHPDKVEAILEIMASFSTTISPRGEIPPANKPPVQIHIHQCPDCAQTTVPTSKGELTLNKTEVERAQCDCLIAKRDRAAIQISHPHERNKTSIPPATRRQVLAHYRHQCQRPGCGHTLFLEAHHIIPRAEGGSNEPENLTCLCSACHKLVHDKNISAASWVTEQPPLYYWQTAS